MICESRFVDWLCLFVDHFKTFFVKFVNQNFPSVRIFVFRETTKFPFRFQARQCWYLSPISAELYTIFLHLDRILAAKLKWGSLQCYPYYLAVGTTQYIFADYFRKDISNHVMLLTGSPSFQVLLLFPLLLTNLFFVHIFSCCFIQHRNIFLNLPLWCFWLERLISILRTGVLIVVVLIWALL